MQKIRQILSDFH